MTAEQIAKILSLFPDQAALIVTIQVTHMDGGPPILNVFFANGDIEYYDAAGKPVFST